MPQPLRTCSHIKDTGAICNSMAAKHQKYCAFHLRYRARQLHIAQVRAHGERLDLHLGPLEDLYAVQSALSHLAEALAADLIDPKRAHALMAVLRLMSLNFRHPEKWQTNLYHSDQPAEVDVAKEYGLPRDLDLDTPPDLAFPLNESGSMGGPQLPDVGNCGGVTTDNRPLTTDNLDFRPDSPVSPEWLELRYISRTQGAAAADIRFRQLERNRARRELRSDRKRYGDLALRLNLKKAAERLAERKVAEKLAEAGIAPTPANAETFDFESQVAANMKKSAASFAEIDAYLAGKEVKTA